MNKPIILAVLLASFAATSFAQDSAASAPAPAASSAKKHKWAPHAPKLRKGATAAVNPQASPDKKGGN